MKSTTKERRFASPKTLLPLLLLAIALGGCKPSFRTPEQAGDAIFVALVHDDEEYLNVVLASREDLNLLYRDFNTSADATFSAKLDSFHQEAQLALPAAMDAFRDGANKQGVKLTEADAHCNNNHTENSRLSANIDLPLKKAIVWVDDEYSYESNVLIIRHLARVNDTWVMVYPEFTWMTSEEYYESDYGDEYLLEEEVEIIEDDFY